jgi:hypothetical protein
MVPVTVMRTVNGQEGSLQFMPGNSTDEGERSSSGQGGKAICPITDQWEAMYIFDVLIYNERRTRGRIMYDKSTWQLILSEHNRAFASKKGRPKQLKNSNLTVSAGWKSALGDLTDEVLQETFSDVLDKRRLRSLATRRDQLLFTRSKP